MKFEEATGKFLALATKCGNKHDTIDLALSILDEVYKGFQQEIDGIYKATTFDNPTWHDCDDCIYLTKDLDERPCSYCCRRSTTIEDMYKVNCNT